MEKAFQHIIEQLENALNVSNLLYAGTCELLSVWVRNTRELKSSFGKLYDVIDYHDYQKEVEKELQKMIKDEHNITPNDAEYSEYYKAYQEVARKRIPPIVICPYVAIENGIIGFLGEEKVLSIEQGEKYEEDFDTAFMIIHTIDGIKLSEKGKMIENNINIANAKIDNLLYKLKQHKIEKYNKRLLRFLTYEPIPNTRRIRPIQIKYLIDYSILLGKNYVYIGCEELFESCEKVEDVINFKFGSFLKELDLKGFKIKTCTNNYDDGYHIYLCWGDEVDTYLYWEEDEPVKNPKWLDEFDIEHLLLRNELKEKVNTEIPSVGTLQSIAHTVEELNNHQHNTYYEFGEFATFRSILKNRQKLINSIQLAVLSQERYVYLCEALPSCSKEVAIIEAKVNCLDRMFVSELESKGYKIDAATGETICANEEEYGKSLVNKAKQLYNSQYWITYLTWDI